MKPFIMTKATKQYYIDGKSSNFNKDLASEKLIRQARADGMKDCLFLKLQKAFDINSNEERTRLSLLANPEVKEE